ncbi:bacteriophage T4 gp5 trimerization domain-containing protein, partial [Avibacterium avium]
QPIITGRTYHTRNVPPGALPQSKTQMALRSKTYKGEGYNELLFEDAPGQEQLNLHAQRDMNTVVLNDRNTIVIGNHSEAIHDQQSIEITANRYMEIYQNSISRIKELSIDVGNMYQIFVDGNITFTSESEILLKTNGSFIKISNSQVNVKGEKEVSANGEQVFLNE